MTPVGRVRSLWRYPVKGMRGEELPQAFAGFSGIYGDRWYSITTSAGIAGFPYLTGRTQTEMLRCAPRYRHPGKMLQPVNLAEAEALGSGVTSLYADGDDWAVDVRMPDGSLLPVDEASLLARLEGSKQEQLALRRSHRPMTDCRPVSLISQQTVDRLNQQVGEPLDARRFRANIYLDLDSAPGFAEDGWVDARVQIGLQVVLAILGRDARCKIITLDPETGEANPEVMRVLSQEHEGKAGIYAAVLKEGTIRPGDIVSLLD